VERIREHGVDLEDATAEPLLDVLAHLVEHGVHAVAVQGHRHPVRIVGHADRFPGRQPDAHGLPAAGEAADVVRVHVHGEVAAGHVTADLDGIAVLRGRPEVGDLVAILGVVADETCAELGDEVRVEQARQLGRAAHAVQRVRAHERDRGA
jgi:hypothetical protein